jgi:D-3-phosphoglycerate dehydrogenase
MFKIWLEELLLDSVQTLFDGAAELIGPRAPIERLGECDAVLVSGGKWDGPRMDLAPKLRVVSRIGVGYENIDVDAATERNIMVCYTPLAPSVSTAEHAIGLMFAVAKQIVYADRDMRAGNWHREFWTVKGMELRDRTLGLVGVGRIGANVATVARAIGMQVVCYDPYLSEKRATEIGVTPAADLESLLRQSDVVSLHAPSTPETYKLMNAERFAQLKSGSILINTARGALVDEAALIAALESGQLSGAGLDVFEVEPIPTNHPLLKFENVVVTDHIASHTWAGHHRLYETAARQALQALRGEMPDNVLNATGLSLKN